MLPDITLEALRYFDRTALEALQMHARYLRDLVSRHARSLPLRYIHAVVPTYDAVNIHLAEDRPFITMPTRDEQDVEMIFRRVNNTFIFRLEVGFRQEHLRLLYCLRAYVDDFQCQIRALRVRGTEMAIDYAVVEFLGVCLKPHVYEMWIWAVSVEEEYIMLFAHNALRGNLRHLVFELDGAPLPACIIPELLSGGVVETCAIETAVDPRPWIGHFVETFKTAELKAGIVPSVTLLHKRYGEDSPLRRTVDFLGQPRRSAVTTPQCAFIKEFFRRERQQESTITESTVAELFEFESASLAWRLEVFAWTVEEVDNKDQTSLHCAWLFNVVDL